MTVVRAVEQRRPLVRASTAGPSIIVAPSGPVVAPGLARTPYARLGDLFALACALVALAACVRPR